MRTRLVLAAVPVALLGVVAASASAAPPKPIEKSYAASAPVPGGWVGGCDGSIPGAAQLDDFKVPAAGTLKIDLVEFVGDWDLVLFANGSELAISQNIQPLNDQSEVISHKFKKATTVSISACNFNGGPDGTVKLKFTYA